MVQLAPGAIVPEEKVNNPVPDTVPPQALIGVPTAMSPDKAVSKSSVKVTPVAEKLLLKFEIV